LITGGATARNEGSKASLILDTLSNEIREVTSMLYARLAHVTLFIPSEY